MAAPSNAALLSLWALTVCEQAARYSDQQTS